MNSVPETRAVRISRATYLVLGYVLPAVATALAWHLGFEALAVFLLTLLVATRTNALEARP